VSVRKGPPGNTPDLREPPLGFHGLETGPVAPVHVLSSNPQEPAIDPIRHHHRVPKQKLCLHNRWPSTG
jgi:hypothetical protein